MLRSWILFEIEWRHAGVPKRDLAFLYMAVDLKMLKQLYFVSSLLLWSAAANLAQIHWNGLHVRKHTTLSLHSDRPSTEELRSGSQLCQTFQYPQVFFFPTKTTLYRLETCTFCKENHTHLPFTQLKVWTGTHIAAVHCHGKGGRCWCMVRSCTAAEGSLWV